MTISISMHDWIRRAVWPSVVAAAMLAAGCGGGSGGAAPNPPAAANPPVVIGAAGGVVRGPDGVSVTVPAGALAADTTLQIVAATPATALALPNGIAASSRMYALLPHGTRFGIPATLSLPRAASDPADSTLLKTNAAGTAWEQLLTASAGDSHSALIVGFSYVMMCGGCVPNPGPPVISMQPASGSVNEGGLVFLSVAAIGAQPLRYTWISSRFGILGTQTSPAIVVNPVTMADDGLQLRVQVTDRFGQSVTSAPGIVSVVPAAPVIASEPIDVSAVAGTPALFSALSTSSVAQELNWQRFDPQTQQWGASLSTSNRLMLPNVSLATDDQALFRMTARNAAGGPTVATRAARLTVLAAESAPQIVVAPQDVTTVAGRSATFEVLATGGGLQYEWYRNDGPGGSFQPVGNGNGSAQLVLSNADASDDGAMFRVVVRNGVATAASPTARLSVAPSVGSAPTRIGGGSGHSIALRADATLVAWGSNALGQLGRGSSGGTGMPQQVSGLSRVATFAVGGLHNLAIDDQGVVSSWGSGSNGVLGHPTIRDGTVPAVVAGLGGAARFVSAGATTSIASTGNDFYSWGAGHHGDGQYAFRATPATLSGYGFVVGSAGRGSHTLAIGSDGTVWAWGHNSFGQLGTGDFGARITPEPVTGLPRAVAVSASTQHSLALTQDGTVYAWGGGFAGQLGTGDDLGRTRPVVVPLHGPAVAIAAGSFHSIALLADGRVFAWGYNAEGAIGTGDFVNAMTPTNVAGGWTGRIVALGAGDRHSLAVAGAGAVWAWGLNDSMQLGDGTATLRNRPVQTIGVNLN